MSAILAMVPPAMNSISSAWATMTRTVLLRSDIRFCDTADGSAVGFYHRRQPACVQAEVLRRYNWCRSQSIIGRRQAASSLRSGLSSVAGGFGPSFPEGGQTMAEHVSFWRARVLPGRAQAVA